jgi:uncharacterized protein (DUF433 family)
MPVWGLEAARRAGLSNEQILQMYPSLELADLLAAWRYVKSHTKEINRDIAENEKA